ncbi:helix-turn-helix transcriptional regulator [Natronosalvus rutilus]|uniref:HTH iclR-type domain-containing protein n=1 Tax=Natronosalvus rutilus TaxID=2953753 RepID=A0A9E7N851_9EURY|nr:helix-turn-helix domain-containing protein [Natronosalvus rutilus]UTF52294.1 hypothetical protein NGM29_10880 [Natronosalvus rutilus]
MNGSALRTGILVIALLVTAVGGGTLVAAADSTTAVERERQPGMDTEQPAFSAGEDRYASAAAASFQEQGFETTTFIVTVNDDGSAIWTFRYERILEGDEAKSEFETFAEEFESEETELYADFASQAEVLLNIGREETDREMEATDFNRTARIEQGFNTRGVVEMSFTWNGFAQVNDGEVVAGDVFEGNFVVASDQSLVVETGDGLRFADVQPVGELSASSLEASDSVTWTGRKQFLDGQPRVVFESESAGGPVESGDDTENESALPLSTIAMALAGGAILLGLLVAGISRYGLLSRTDRSDPDSRPEPTREPDQSPAQPIPDDELLSDEDRVISLIRERGGRMKQVDIVDETGWSKSKVSMLLSEMESDGTISKLRVGRENIISLEGFEPEATRSPFEE